MPRELSRVPPPPSPPPRPRDPPPPAPPPRPVPQCGRATGTGPPIGASQASPPPPLFHGRVMWRRPWGVISQARFARAVERRYALSRVSTDRVTRAAPLSGTDLVEGDAAPSA